MKPREFEQRAVNYIREKEIFVPGEKVLLASSGGADSVAMTYLLKKISRLFSLELFMIHINHNLRGEDSKRDENFVVMLAQKLELGIEVVSVNILDFEGTTEERARKARHSALEYFRKKSGASKIAVGHTAGDRAETVIHNLARGAGLTGISAMRPVNGFIVRPLLFATRVEIIEYLADLNASFIQDETNNDLRFSRNRIRHKIIPELEKIFSGATRSISRFATIANDESEYLTKLTKQIYLRCVEVTDDKVTINTVELLKENKVIIRRAIRMALTSKDEPPTFSVVESVLKLISTEDSKQLRLGNKQIKFKENILTITSLRERDKHNKIECG